MGGTKKEKKDFLDSFQSEVRPANGIETALVALMGALWQDRGTAAILALLLVL